MNPIEDEPSFIGPRPEPNLAPAQVVGTPVTPVVSRQGVSNKTPLATAPSDPTGDGPDNDNHAPPLTDQDPSDFTPAQEAFIRQLLDQQRGTLNTSWRNHLDQQAGHAEKEHQSIHLQHAKQITHLGYNNDTATGTAPLLGGSLRITELPRAKQIGRPLQTISNLARGRARLEPSNGTVPQRKDRSSHLK